MQKKLQKLDGEKKKNEKAITNLQSLVTHLFLLLQF